MKLSPNSTNYMAVMTALIISSGIILSGNTVYADELIPSLTISSGETNSSEVLLAIGDGPVDDAELGINSAEDISALTDGSMIPEYNITEAAGASSSVVSTQYTEASLTSAGSQDTSAVAASDDVIEGTDSVSDISSLTSIISGANQNTGTIAQGISSIVTAVTAASQNKSSEDSDIIAVNTAASGETTSIVSAITNTVNSVVTNGISVPVVATTAGRQALINYAKQFLGNPYIYGGTSLTEGADCSGFVQQIFKYFGITTGRTSRDQIENAQAISYEELQPGDLIFYASGDYVNHVAIYAGNGVIIHAANATTGICTGRYDYRTPYAYGRFLNT